MEKIRANVKSGKVELVMKDPIYVYCKICGELKQKKLEFGTLNYECGCSEEKWSKSILILIALLGWVVVAILFRYC